ncbi:hypothetical protein D3C75_695900 [compost metagenome]
MERRRDTEAVILFRCTNHVPVIGHRRKCGREENLAAEAFGHLLQQMGWVQIEQLQEHIAAPNLCVGNIPFIIGFEGAQHTLDRIIGIQQAAFPILGQSNEGGGWACQLHFCLSGKRLQQLRQFPGIFSPLSLPVFIAVFAQGNEKAIHRFGCCA